MAVPVAAKTGQQQVPFFCVTSMGVLCWVQGMAGVLSLPSGSNNKALRRAPALDALKSRTGFQGFYVLGLLIQV